MPVGQLFGVLVPPRPGPRHIPVCKMLLVGEELGLRTFIELHLLVERKKKGGWGFPEPPYLPWLGLVDCGLIDSCSLCRGIGISLSDTGCFWCRRGLFSRLDSDLGVVFFPWRGIHTSTVGA